MVLFFPLLYQERDPDSINYGLTNLLTIVLWLLTQWCPEKCFPCEPGTVCKEGRQYECRPGTYSDGTGRYLPFLTSNISFYRYKRCLVVRAPDL